MPQAPSFCNAKRFHKYNVFTPKTLSVEFPKSFFSLHTATMLPMLPIIF